MSDAIGENTTNKKGDVLDEKTARSEINNWLDEIDYDEIDFFLKNNESKEVSEEEFSEESKEENSNDHEVFYNKLLKYAMKGVLVFNEDGTIQHNLLKPIMKKGGGVHLDTINYDCDVNYGTFKTKLKAEGGESGEERLSAVVSAIAGQPSGVLYKLKFKDAGIANAIAIFLI